MVFRKHWMGGSPDYYHVDADHWSVSIPNNFYSQYYNVNSVNLNSNDNAYAGIVAIVQGNPFSHEYIEQTLSEPMVAGQTYTFEAYVQLAERSTWAIDLSVMFTDDPVCQHYWDVIDPAGISNQMVTANIDQASGFLYDYETWHVVQLEFTATQNWNQVTIGGIGIFQNVVTTNSINPEYYNGSTVKQCIWFIDEVSLRPTPVITQGTDITICDSDLPLTLDATFGPEVTTYHWSSVPSGGVPAGQEDQQSISITPTVGNYVFTVTVDGPNGCEFTDDINIVVESCCFQETSPGVFAPNLDDETYPFTDPTLTTALDVTNNVIEDQVFSVNGPWNITAGSTLTLRHCDIALGANATIIVQSGATLNIEANSGDNPSYLHACTEMWNAISVLPGGTLNVNGGSIVESARFGTYLFPGANYTLNNAVYNRNHVHVHISDLFFTGNTNGSIYNSTFMCHTTAGDLNSIFANLLPPLQDEITEIGVLNVKAQDLAIGENNHFENAHYGIMNTQNSLTVLSNNTFNNMVYESSFGIFSGSGIFAQNGAELNVSINNDFTNSRFGVLGFNHTDYVRIRTNYFDNVITGVGIGSFVNSPAPNKSIEIVNNVMKNMRELGIMCFNNPSADMNIYENDIDLAPIDDDWRGFGIRVVESTPLFNTRVSVSENIISNATDAIWLQGLVGTISDINPNTDVNHNIITLPVTEADQNAIGVHTTDVTGSYIRNNSIDGGALVNWSWWRKGIEADNGNSNIIRCNTTGNMSIGLYLKGALAPSWVLQNDMNNNNFGIFQDGGGTLGNIGFDNGNGTRLSFDNSWQGTMETAEVYRRLYVTNGNAPNYDLFTRFGTNNPVFIPITSVSAPDGSNPILVNPGTSGDDMQGDPCVVDGVGAPAFLLSVTNRQRMMKRALENDMDNSLYGEAMVWLNELSVYRSLLVEDSLVIGDTLLTDFRDNCDASNLGILVRASDALSTGKDELEYLGYLNAISTSIVPEDAWRDVLVIAYEKALDSTVVVDSPLFRVMQNLQVLFPDETLETPTRPNTDWSTAQATTLEFVASQCPYEYGVAVYMARAMLEFTGNTNFTPTHFCESSAPPSNRLSGGDQTEETSVEQNDSRSVSVFPNPARNQLGVTIQIDDDQSAKFELRNYLGHIITRNMLINGENQIDVSDLSSGIYHYSILIDGSIKVAGKQVILR